MKRLNATCLVRADSNDLIEFQSECDPFMAGILIRHGRRSTGESNLVHGGSVPSSVSVKSQRCASTHDSSS